jgi:hypothetical protein
LEKKYYAVVIVIVAVLLGLWFVPVWEGKNVYQLVFDKVKGWMSKHD